MNVELKPGERVDELQRNGYRIIQDPGRFCFGMDAVLLSGFARVKPGERALDLGTGTGIIPILLEARTQGESFTGLEIQEESADMARRSVSMNGLEDRIHIVTGDIKEAAQIFGAASYHVVTCNPPYMTANHGLRNPKEHLAIARHEVLCTLEDCQDTDAGGPFLHGAPAVPAGGDHDGTLRSWPGTQEDAPGLSFCGPGAQYGIIGSDERRKTPDYRGETADHL